MVQKSMGRELDCDAGLIDFSITSSALPPVPAIIQQGIRRYLDYRASLVDLSVTAVALPSVRGIV
jgi:hypothetical protein